MDKIISSLLCCSVDSKDDADDKVHNQQPSNKSISSKNNIRTNVAKGKGHIETPKERADEQKANHDITKKIQHDKKDLLDDDNSINETDTITNTNDENVQTSNNQQQDTNHQETSQVELSRQDSRIQADNDQGDNNKYVEEVNEDEESFLDLTKLQEGQAFNSETGFLLGVKDKKFSNKKCLILDFDETLVHSSFKYLRTADFVIPVEIDNQIHHVYVIKRPGVDEFLEKVGQWFEVVVFTASVSKYGDPLLDKLDIHRSVHHRLFRDSCYNYQGNFIKNLSQIGRPLNESIIIDNSPASYIFHPQHSIPISSWFSDTHDNELIDLLPFLEDISKSNVDDVSLILDITV